MLEVHGLESGYGLVPVLHDATLKVQTGEVVVVLGPNGAGKSTLLRTISGLLPARVGRVRLDGDLITGRPAHEVAQRGIAHVIEGRGIFPNLTVRENLALGQFMGSNRAKISDRIESAVDHFPWMKARLNEPGGKLSGGQQQMLAIARALIGEPRLLMLDEPSLGLAPLITDELFDRIRTLATTDRAVLIVEQQIHRALQIADRGYVMRRGRLILEDTAESLRTGNRIESAYMS